VNAGSVVLLGGGYTRTAGQPLGPFRTPVKRAPLGPWPQPQDYKSVLPFTPPAGRDLNFYRGNFCGLRIAGAPAVPGSNGANPTCIMSCLLDNYTPDIQERYLQQYVDNGYTHLQRSVFHALHYGSSLQQYIDLSKKARAMGLFCDHWFLAGEDVCPGGRNQHVSFWQSKIDPLMGPLLDAGVMDLTCVGWQLDGYNEPGNTLIEIIKYVADAVPKTVPVATHWMNEALAWWKKVGTRPDGGDVGEVWSDEYQTIEVHDRFSWWYAMQPYLTHGHHQGNTRMLCKEYQDRLCDTLDFFGSESGRDTGKGDMGQSHRNGVQPFRLTAWETSGQDQFDDQPANPHGISEDEGDQRDYILMCTTSKWGHMSGYGNGGRRPDGSWL